MECLPHYWGTRYGKHITIKKSTKSEREYYNCKGFFSLVLLALDDAEYRFLWVDVGSIGSKLRLNIEDGTLGLPPSELLGQGGPDLHYFLLGDNAFSLMPWTVKPYSRRQLTREERIANYRISRGGRVVENAFGILVSRFRVLQGTMEQKPMVVRDIVFTCVMWHNNADDTPGQDTHPSQMI